MTCKLPSYLSVYQHGYLFVCILLGVCMGLWQEILTPTLPNLSVKLNVSYESMGYALSFRSGGGVVALLVAAVVYDTYPYMIHYLLSLECLLAGIVTILIPWSTSYWMVIVLFFIQSGCQNSINNGGVLLVLSTFKENSIGKMQLFALGYGFGAVISGLISKSYVTRHVTGQIKLTKYCLEYNAGVTVTNTSHSSNISSTSSNGKFEHIFLIAGLIAIFSSIVFLLYKFIPNPTTMPTAPKKKESWFRKLSPSYVSEGRTNFGVIMIILIFLYYFFYIIGLLTFIPYIVVYAMDPCKEYTMSQQEATNLHTLTNVFFSLGRVFGSLVLNANPIKSILTINIMNLLFNIILVTLSNKYPLSLWIGACGMRFCNSIVYPSGTSFINKYIIVTSSLVSLAFLGDMIGAFAGATLGGYLIDNYPSKYITYGCMSGMVMLLVIIIVMVSLVSRYEMRDFSKDNAQTDTDNKVELKTVKT